MEKQRKWQFALILAVIALTLYNILPTLFYYCKPLKSPIDSSRGKEIGTDIEKRVNSLEDESLKWIASFAELIQAKPASIHLDSQNPQFITVQFTKSEDAARFRNYLPRAGSLIPFAPAQLSIAAQEDNAKQVIVQRHIPIHLDSLFSFTPKKEADGSPSSLYKDLIIDRIAQIAYSLGGPSEPALILGALEHHPEHQKEYIEALASQINRFSDLALENEPASSRFAASFTQGSFQNRPKMIQFLIAAFDSQRDLLKKEKSSLLEIEKKAKEEGLFLTEDQQELLRLLEKKEIILSRAENTLKKHQSLFSSGENPWTVAQLKISLQHNPNFLTIGKRNPVFSEISIDWINEKISLIPHSQLKNTQLLINEIAKVTRMTKETIGTENGEYTIPFHKLSNVSGLLVIGLDQIAHSLADQLSNTLKLNWHPQHPDLQNIPIVDWNSYQTLAEVDKALALIIHEPNANAPGLRGDSLYVIIKGIDRVFQNAQNFPNSEQSRLFKDDFQKLAQILQQNGFVGYRGSEIPSGGYFDSDFVFERNNFYFPVIAATREDFSILGTQRYAFLELSDVEQRLVATNRIETKIHEDLLKWKDEYHSAQISLNPASRFDVPKPTRSVFWSNALLSARKFFRGDERRIIRWGLDLSGGKTVQIELRDANNRPVTNEADLKQGINELYNRVNKMGVSEVSIRQVGNQIVLDFPGSQSLSASELIKASSMYFHIVNEKFSSGNPSLSESVNRFLQEVWNEAVVTNRKDPHSINEIAWRHLYGKANDPDTSETQSESGKILLENGLKIQSPDDAYMGNNIDDSTSKIAVYRGNDYTEWHGQTHPLLIVFRNYALEGSQLDHVRSNYDPSKGNYLSFDVAGASMSRDGRKINPRNDLYAWTSKYSKDRIAGTQNEAFSRGHGWRMAVILNDTVINAPTLDSALRDSAMISGSFSQREVNQLVADLKAGSLTFTPHILSEKNVSPELGQKDRVQGITATIIALILVVAAMVLYYRFAGFVASVAVLFNLLITWATLQNLGASLSLAGLAGIILNIGMAVDANVLVFERIKEEFSLSGKISSAIAAGYKKAYSAIVDSNVTTIIAALILLNFDAGPIKAFAITLIIGIVSSMFTALFMTRFYFAGWIQNPKNKELKMANWIYATKIDFLKKAKAAFAVAAAIILCGGYFIYAERSTLFGMDFTGGFSLNLELQGDGDQSYIQSVQNAFVKNGANNHDFQIRELNPTNHLRILFGTSMEQPKKPFFGMPIEQDGKNPRIEWVVQALQSSDLNLTPKSLSQLESNWTVMSGQMSDTMRNNALIGLLISFVSIFIYIAFRFEYKFAAAAIICLLHDVLITLGLMGLLHAMKVPVQIDLNTVAAIMTIIGYSLNDTIIIFDRIREEMSSVRNKPLSEIVNTALNFTLSRTSITSGTTLLVLVALVCLGGSSIFSFALVMTIGVIFGTLSSWFIASPLMLYFHGKEEAKERELVQQA